MFLDIGKGRGPFTIYYELHGNPQSNVKIVLVNGFLTPCSEWYHQLDFLKEKDYEILVYDNRGIGKSGEPTSNYSSSDMAKDIIEIVDHLKWDKFNVVGISMGGMISLELSYLAKDRIKSLVLAVTHSGSLPPVRGMLTICQTLVTGDARKRGHLLLPVLYSQQYLDKLSLIEPTRTNRDVLVDSYVEKSKTQKPPGLRGVVGHIQTVMTHSVSTKRLKEIKDKNFPICIMTGTDDYLVKTSNSHYLREILTPAEFIVFDGAGHVINVENKIEFNEAIIKNINRSI
ncbi:hypothetical protein DLAC_00444 [Tieghemostelium lacteum]|uniref:AB hydrolase-1 domain-containing protein n=1 Tax=Tieghemostelium lacteum TaxID=361077 RepID=A0A152AA06_TIELA|nr:hypothetical protein DLAC_00444 [Tieghemostelium lacteum]|eukprot:KYR02961.1 hypothetical protein DLAC_00444 [Tieghemostelium lacteum]